MVVNEFSAQCLCREWKKTYNSVQCRMKRHWRSQCSMIPPSMIVNFTIHSNPNNIVVLLGKPVKSKILRNPNRFLWKLEVYKTHAKWKEIMYLFSNNNSEQKKSDSKLKQDSDSRQHAQNNKRSGVKNSWAI